MSAIERYRKDQTSSPWANALLVVPLGVGLAAIYLELWIVMIVAAVIAVVGGVAIYRSARVHPRVEYDEYQEGDVPALAFVGPFIPFVASLPVGSAVLDFPELPQLVSTLGVAGLQAVAFWFAVRRSEVRNYRVGKRRAARALKSADLEDATGTRLDAVDKHRDLLTAMLSTGAVDGLRVDMGSVAKLLEAKVDDVVSAARELAGLELVKIAHRPWEKKKEKVPMSLTQLGVQVMAESRRR